MPSPRLPGAAGRWAGSWSSPPHGLYRQSWAPRRQRHGDGQRRRLRRRLVRRRRTDGPGRPPATGGPGRSGPTRHFADLARVVRSGALLAAVRVGHAPAPTPDEARRGAVRAERWLFSHNGARDRLAAARAAALAAALPAADAAAPGGPQRLRAGVGAARCAGCAGASTAGEALADAGPRGRGGRPAARSTCCSPTARTIAATAWGDTLWYRRRARRGARRLRAVRRRPPALAGGPGPHPARGDAAPDVRCSPPLAAARMTTRPRHPHTLDATTAHRDRTRFTLDDRLPADSSRAALRADVAARPHRHAQDAAAEVVLRRARQRPVRADHPAARVLPDPRRARDPHRAAPPRSPRPTRRRAPSSNSARAPPSKTRLLLDALTDGRHPARYVPVDVSDERAGAGRRRP